MRQYSNALHSLALVSGADTRSHRTRLMASVLLACFDSFIGDHKQAIKQIQIGLTLLEQIRSEPTDGEPVDEELIHMFTRLAIQAKSYDMAFHFPKPYVVLLSAAGSVTPSGYTPGSADPSLPQVEHVPSSSFAAPVYPESYLLYQHIPDAFTTVMEARLAWDCLCERIFRFTEIMFAHSRSGLMGILPEIVARRNKYGLQFRADFERWASAFHHILMRRNAPGVSSQEKAGIAVLKMSHLMGNILFLMTFSDSEAQFDRFTPRFQAIVDLALEVVGDEERRAAAKWTCQDPHFCKHRKHPRPSATDVPGRTSPDLPGFHVWHYDACHVKPSFSADMGIVPPLFVVATKCRDPLIRRQAIQLLRSSPRREAMWDSELAAHIGSWILGVEEEGIRCQPSFPSEPPSSWPPHDDVDLPPSPARSSITATSSSTETVSVSRVGSLDYGSVSLGLGRIARWQCADPTSPGSNGLVMRRRDSLSTFLPPPSHVGDRRTILHPSELITAANIPEERRVMVRAVDFDLRARFALVQVGSRGLPTGSLDVKTRVTRITW